MSLLQKVPAVKLQWLALALLAVYPLAIAAARLDIWHFRNSFLLFIVAAVVGFVVLVLSVLKMSKGQDQDSKALIIAVAATLIPLGILGNSIINAKSYPFIHDISTDLVTPPALMAAEADRIAGDHPVSYEGPELAALQQTGYPDLSSLVVVDKPLVVFNKARSVVVQSGWQILAENNTDLPYTLEAVDTSLLFGFKDDVVIRIKETMKDGQASGSLIDVRSMSRQGKSDLGVNAKRIIELLNQLQAVQ
jgi:uncharacterized protein (DUF1499 family)